MNEISKKLESFLEDHPEFKGEFIGYKISRGGLGISRTDNDWYECDDYLIPLQRLIEVIESNSGGNALLGKAAPSPVQTAGSCEWGKEDADNDCYYETECGNAFQTLNGDYQHNHFTHCPFCGKPIKDKVIEEND